MAETLKQIEVDEGGYRAEVYLDSLGIRTWLIGRNIKDRPITDDEWGALEDVLKQGMTQKEWAEMLFNAETDIVSAELQYNHKVDMRRLPWEVQVIIINMAFNMGTTRFNPKKWPNFFKAIAAGDWKKAALEMKYEIPALKKLSAWYTQTGSRAIRLVKSMHSTL